MKITKRYIKSLDKSDPLSKFKNKFYFEDKKVLDELSKDSVINEIVNFDKIKSLFKSKKRSNEESKFLFNYLSVRYFMECFS